MFWFFKNKQVHNRVKEIEKSLGISFSKIKNEFLIVHKRVHESHTITNKKLDELHYRLSNLENLFSSVLSQKYLPEKTKKLEEESLEEGRPLYFSTLTDGQKKLFAEIIGLHIETGSEWISLVEVAKQAHPGKEYKRVRSTLSEFTSVLEEAGLLSKKIQRKKAFVKVTNKGILYVDEDRAKRLRKIMRMPS